MAEQYFTADPTCESKQVPCSFVYRGHGLNFMTDAGVFSKGELDTGTRLLLDALPDVYGDVLDLGCGWGAIGVAVKKKYPAAHVTMVDVNRRALELCRFNAVRNGITAECLESDGMAEVMERTFDFIITNPPIRASKPVIYRMFADAASRLNPGGALYLVIRKQQGGGKLHEVPQNAVCQGGQGGQIRRILGASGDRTAEERKRSAGGSS